MPSPSERDRLQQRSRRKPRINKQKSILTASSGSFLQIQRRDIQITTILIPIPIPPNKTKPLKPPAPPNHPLFLPNANKRRSLQKSPPVTRPPPRPAVPMIMMEQPPHVPGGGLLGSSIRHVRAQLRGQNRNVRASAFVFDEDRLEVVEFVFGDLRVGGEDLLGGGAELQVA